MKRKIKIAHVITRMDRGGAPDFARLFCAYLDPKKFDIRLVTGYTKYPSVETKKFLRSFKRKTFLIPQLIRNINPIYDLIAFFKLVFYFKKQKFDIVHTHTAKAGGLGRVAAKVAGVPHVVHTPHGHNFYGYFGPVGNRLIVWAEQFLAQFNDRLVVLTELERKDYIKFKVVKRDQTMVINSGLELERFQNLKINHTKKRAEFGLQPKDFVVGLISRLEPVKGVEYLAKAAAQIVQEVPSAKFLIVGEGSQRAKMEAICRKAKIEGDVVFTGWREDVPEILHIIDVLVQPSLNEAVGRVFLEAGACGVPVVATKVGGIPEVVIHEETGLLVRSRSAKYVADAVIEIAKHGSRRAKMSRNARQWVDEKFNIHQMIDAITDLYTSLIDGKTN